MSFLENLVRSPIFWVMVLLAVALNYVGKMDFEDAIQQQSHYCKMVKQGMDTDGKAGWPDYLNTYKSECISSSSE